MNQTFFSENQITRSPSVVFWLSLVLVCCFALYARFLFWSILGGFEPSYMEYGYKYLNAGPTGIHLVSAQAILDAVSGRVKIELIPELAWKTLAHAWAVYPAGYATFLTGLAWSGLTDLQNMRIAQFGLDALTVFPLAYILRSMSVSRTLTIVACLGYALAPWWASASTLLRAESLSSAGMICILALMMAAKQRSDIIRWIALGFAAGILSQIRSDMILLFIPLGFWAAFAAPKGAKIHLLATVLCAFFALPFAWGFYNLSVHGSFVLTSNAGWYALWSGLGMFPNDFGFIVSDGVASKTLTSHSILSHTPQAEAFWREKYLSVLLEHPGYVVISFFKRLVFILFSSDVLPHQPFPELTKFITLGPWLAGAAILGLLFRKRFLEAYVVMTPIVYALGSLGPVYAEPRYVTYAGLSYLLGAVVVIQLIAELLNQRFRLFTLPGLQHVTTLAIIAIVGACTLRYFTLLLPIASAHLAVFYTPPSPDRNPQELSWTISQQGVKLEKSPEGSLLLMTAGAPGYQIQTPVALKGSKDFLFRIKSSVSEGMLAAVFLTTDLSRVMSSQYVTGSEEQSYVLIGHSDTSPVNLVIAEARSDGGVSRAQIKSFSLTMLCTRQATSLLQSLTISLSSWKFEECPAS